MEVWYEVVVSLQDNMVTMHDVLDAQWMLDNNRDGEISTSELVTNVLTLW